MSLFNVIAALNDVLHTKKLNSFSVKFYELEPTSGYSADTFVIFIATDDLHKVATQYLNWHGKIPDYNSFKNESIFSSVDVLIGLELTGNGNIFIADYVTHNFLNTLSKYTTYGIVDLEKAVTDYLHTNKLPAGQSEKEFCSHTWQSYTGLQRTFEFCTKCDLKR